jgi:hypothetical protein
MRIVNRKEFLGLPAGTVYMRVPEQPRDGVSLNLNFDGAVLIKDESSADDFLMQELFPWFEDVADTGEWVAVMERMLRGEPSPPLDYDCVVRDGRSDLTSAGRQLFMVWERTDLQRMIERLQRALKEGYPGV